MQQNNLINKKKFLITMLFVSILFSVLLINFKSHHTLENLIRSITAFFIVPSWILYVNNHHLWFRKALRWIVNGSQRLIQSAIVFFVCMLVSHEILMMIPNGYGLFLHILFLGLGAIAFWTPLLIRCSFRRDKPFMQKLVYLILTSITFFLYHEMVFRYYESSPTLGFMITGLIVMFITSLFLFKEWVQSEAQQDRITVKGYIRPLSRDR